MNLSEFATISGRAATLAPRRGTRDSFTVCSRPPQHSDRIASVKTAISLFLNCYPYFPQVDFRSIWHRTSFQFFSCKFASWSPSTPSTKPTKTGNRPTLQIIVARFDCRRVRLRRGFVFFHQIARLVRRHDRWISTTSRQLMTRIRLIVSTHRIDSVYRDFCLL